MVKAKRGDSLYNAQYGKAPNGKKFSGKKEAKEFAKAVNDALDLDRGTTRKESYTEGDYECPQDALAKHVQSVYKNSSTLRRDVEDRWLEDLRQYRGQYSQDVLKNINANRSRAYIRITRTKVKTVDSRLTDFLFPANGDKNWGISETTLPDYTNEQIHRAVSEHMLDQGEGATPPQTPSEFEQIIINDARKRSESMSKTIEDQLDEIKYREIIRETTHSGNLYGTGILKGPMVSFKVDKQYQNKLDGETGEDKWQLTYHDRITPFAESVSIWDIFPDLSATSLEDCLHITQRHKMNKAKLHELAKRSDFNGAKIKKYLKQQPSGDYEPAWFETEIRAMGDVGVKADSFGADKNYNVLEFWGYIDYETLVENGVEIPERFCGSGELMANVWVLGDSVIKVAMSPVEGVSWPYFFYYYDKDETSIFGEGIASIMRDPQDLINSGFRAMLDHAAITAGPQVEVNLDLISEDEDPQDIRPFKVWTRVGSGYEAQNEAVRIVNMTSHTGEYLTMLENFEKYADEVTTIPRYMWGDQAEGAGRTASGLSMMMGSANITIKDQVKNFDDGITKPFINAMYHWNMQFNTDESIKGDYAVSASGTSSLIAKEVYANSLMQFANITNNPTDLPVTKRTKIIRSIADSLELGDKGLVLTDREIQINQQQQAQAANQERDFMNKMVETAREYGISPQSMIDSLRSAQQEATAPPEQAA